MFIHTAAGNFTAVIIFELNIYENRRRLHIYIYNIGKSKMMTMMRHSTSVKFSRSQGLFFFLSKLSYSTLYYYVYLHNTCT